MYASKSIHQENVIIFNPLIRKCKILPPLNHHPYSCHVMYLIVDSKTLSFKVILVRNVFIIDILKGVTPMIQVFNSCTSKWKVTTNNIELGYIFGDFQNGVYQNGHLFTIAFNLIAKQLAIFAYNVDQNRWLRVCTSPWISSILSNHKHPYYVHLVRCNKEILLCTKERDDSKIIYQYVNKVEWMHSNTGAVLCMLKNVIQRILTNDLP